MRDVKTWQRAQLDRLLYQRKRSGNHCLACDHRRSGRKRDTKALAARALELVGLTDTVRARVSREISAGHKINAVKIYREATGAPLADAKRAVDAWFVPGRGPGVRDAAA